MPALGGLLHEWSSQILRTARQGDGAALGSQRHPTSLFHVSGFPRDQPWRSSTHVPSKGSGVLCPFLSIPPCSRREHDEGSKAMGSWSMSQEQRESGELRCCLHPARLGAAAKWGMMCPKANVTQIRTWPYHLYPGVWSPNTCFAHCCGVTWALWQEGRTLQPLTFREISAEVSLFRVEC